MVYGKSKALTLLLCKILSFKRAYMMKKKVENLTKIEFIHLFISLPTNEVCSLRDINTKLLVRQIKSKIELRVGIPGDLIHLYFMNNELSDDKTLQDYKLKHGCILRVRLHKTWLGLFLACSKGDTFEVFQNGVQAINDETSNEFDAELWNKLVIKRASFALFLATYHGYLSLMLELLNYSAADISGCTVFGRTALHIAAFQGFVGCVSLLLSEGAESSALDVFGKTPLQLAYINRHIYCQKRLYMHQTGGGESHEKSGDGRPKTAPHVMMKNFHQNQRMKKNMSSYSATGIARKETPAENLPSIATCTRDPSIHSQNRANPTPSYDLPVMTIIESSKTYHPEDEIPSQFSAPILRAQTAPVQREGSTQCSTSRGIRGIDAILRTAQDDVVGEYHNIDESIADINVTTLKLSLPREEIMSTNFEAKQPGQHSITSNHNIPGETRAQRPPTKKMLGFVLKAEENRNLDHEKQTNGCSKSEPQQDDQLLTPTNSDGPIADQEGEKLWTPSSNGYPDQPPSDRLWTPLAYENVVENSKTTSPHRKLGPSLSYDAWLEKKRQLEKDAKTERPASATTLKSKVGREMDDTAFKEWLEGKKKFRKRSKSETLTIQHHRAGSGAPFEEWLRQKKQQNESSTETHSHITEKADPRPRQACLGGKTFSEWLAEKGKLNETCENVKTEKRSRFHSGKTFREWLKDKNKEKQNGAILKENLAILELQKKDLVEEQRRLNPRVKTFDQWFEEKRAQSIIELIQSKNIPDKTDLLNSKTKFPEDACLVYDMWLTSKNMEELEREERLYEEMVEKWRRKEQERLQVRKSILSKLNQVKKK